MASNLAGFIDHLEEQVKNGSIYVWGAQGEKATESFIKKNESGNDETRALKLYKKRIKAGYTPSKIRCFDCSGLGMYYIQNVIKLSKADKTANGMMANCTIIQKKHVKKGDMVFNVKKGVATHVGYVVNNNGKVIEAKGRDYGVVESTLSGWDVFGRPKWFADEINAPEEQAEHASFNRILVKGHKGDDVRELQKLLKKNGYPLDTDGSFGPKTKNMVKTCQKDERFATKYADGKAGEMVITILGGKWEGEATAFNKTLVKGDKGDKVAMLQVLLRKAGYNVAVDGSFGAKTTEAVKEFQEKKKLNNSGKAGEKTITKLGGKWVG